MVTFTFTFTYAQARNFKTFLEDEVEEASAPLQQYGKALSGLGLLPDEVRTSDTYVAQKKRYDKAFQALRAFNTQFVKVFAKEYREDRAKTRRQNTEK
jgi:hypothetical protein